MENPVIVGLLFTAAIILFLYVKGRTDPHRAMVGLAMVVGSLILWRMTSDSEPGDEYRTGDTRRRLATNRTALEDWRRHAGTYPATGEDLEDLKNFSQRLFWRDGWERKLRYESTGHTARFVSAGPDGVFDTADDVAG